MNNIKDFTQFNEGVFSEKDDSIAKGIIKLLQTNRYTELQGPYWARKSKEVYKCKIGGNVILESEHIEKVLTDEYNIYYKSEKLEISQSLAKKIHLLIKSFITKK